MTFKGDGKGPIVIGHYASLTGAEATFGTSTDHGITIATGNAAKVQSDPKVIEAYLGIAEDAPSEGS